MDVAQKPWAGLLWVRASQTFGRASSPSPQWRRFPCVHELLISVLVRDRVNSPPCWLRSLIPSQGRYFISPQASPELNPRWRHFIKKHL